jgi:fumarate reductase subunit D
MWLSVLGKSAFVLFVLNEVRGVALAIPVMWGMYQAGGTAMAIWLGFCSLAGIVLSVVAPLAAVKLVRLRAKGHNSLTYGF